MTKNYYLLLAATVALLTMNFHCGKDYIDPAPYDHNFEVPVSITSLKKSYSLTDTIWLQTDVPGKVLFDTKTNQNINADTGKMTLHIVFHQFGTQITAPPDGFCDVITTAGVNTNRISTNWETYGSTDDFGCGQPNYTSRIGFKPNHKGVYSLNLEKEIFFESCFNKIAPYHSGISFKFKPVDLNMDVFNSLSNNDKGGNDGIKFYTDRINKREVFVFRVE